MAIKLGFSAPVVSQTIAATPPLRSVKMVYCSPKTGLGRRVSQKKLASGAYRAIGGVARKSIANRATVGHKGTLASAEPLQNWKCAQRISISEKELDGMNFRLQTFFEAPPPPHSKNSYPLFSDFLGPKPRGPGRLFCKLQGFRALRPEIPVVHGSILNPEAHNHTFLVLSMS